MKLLFDQNLSHHLVSRLADVCPGSAHVRQLGLERADDETVWAYAAANGFTIVSKDSDFHQRSLLFGAPPKLIWLYVGNSPTKAIERLVRDRQQEIRTFIEHPESAFLVLS
ncbi:MAG: DUF5615 family PIN-like protein [Gemmatimonadetes bacterium]|nr:DUF5615 family PIN-like protein [Gemmatimonadota bacterium]